MNVEADTLLKASIVVVNIISGLVCFVIRREISHLKEVVTLRIDAIEKRVDKANPEN
jgi:hypothetical protein